MVTLDREKFGGLILTSIREAIVLFFEPMVIFCLSVFTASRHVLTWATGRPRKDVVRLTFLGLPGVGKTSLIAALGNSLPRFFEDYAITAFGNSLSAHPEIPAFGTVGASQNGGGSLGINLYRIQTGFGKTPFVSVNLADTPGRMLFGLMPGGLQNSSETQLENSFLKIVKESDVLVLCIDSGTLTQADTSPPTDSTGIGALSDLLTLAVVSKGRLRSRVMVALTKVDTLDDEWVADGFRQLRERTRQIIGSNKIFSASFDAQSVAIVPTSAMGRVQQHARFENAVQSLASDPTGNSRLGSINAEQPLLLSLLWCLAT